MKDSSPVGVGIITILTVLLVLCLTIFSALTLSSARADLALSERSAETVQAYYHADAQAAQLYAEFVAGDSSEMEATIPMTDTQSLYLHLVRQGTGRQVEILAWRTTAAQSGETVDIDDTLPVWNGELPTG